MEWSRQIVDPLPTFLSERNTDSSTILGIPLPSDVTALFKFVENSRHRRS